MPPTFPIAPNDIISLTTKAEYQQQTIMNVFHYKAFISSTIADGAAELTALNAFFYNNIWKAAVAAGWANQVVESFRMDWFQAQVIYPNRQFYIRRLVGELGAQPNPGCPSNTGITINWQTQFATRGRSGAKHFTALPLDALTGNRIAPLFVTAWQNLQPLLLEPRDTLAGVGQLVPVVWSMAQPGTPSEVVLATALDEVRIMRRRTFRIGV